jgi:hypothetical protein
MAPDPWQRLVLDDWLADRGGKWAALTCGLAVPRQNGKNGVLEIRELFGMVGRAEKILHTAHEVKTAQKHFRRLKYFFGAKAEDPGAKFPELNALVREVRNVNGQEGIFLHNGGSVELVARSKNSGRGFTVDVLVMDEAQELSEDALEALMPTTSSAPSGNPQWIFAGTPPGPFANGEVFKRVRTEALGEKPKRLAWAEWSIADRSVNLNDKRVWFATNPALNLKRSNGTYALQFDVIEGERARFSPDGFARERCGWWRDDAADSGPFPRGQWERGIDAESSIPDGARLSFCLDVSADRTHSHIAVAGMREDGLPHVEVVASRAGTDWPVRWFGDRASADGPMTVVVQERGAPASSLIDELEQVEGLSVVRWGGADLGNATARLYDLVNASALVEVDGAEPRREGLCHLPQPVLDVAAATAVPRVLTDGGMAWDRRRSPTDIAPLVAVTGALWHALQREEAPTRSAYEDADIFVL